MSFMHTEVIWISIFFSSLFQLFDCRNHIRVVQSMDNGNRLYICGTNAHNPKDYVIYVSCLIQEDFPFYYLANKTKCLRPESPKNFLIKVFLFSFNFSTIAISFLSQVIINQNYKTRGKSGVRNSLQFFVIISD